MDTFKVAVDLRATQPDRQGSQSLRFGSYGNAFQWLDRTYDPDSQKLGATKSGYISGTEMATLSGRSPSAAAWMATRWASISWLFVVLQCLRRDVLL